MTMTARISDHPYRGDYCGPELVTADGRALPLRAARLTGEARGGLARLVLEQRFENRHAEPLRVRYRMPLPADAAISGYEFSLGGRRIVGAVKAKADARAAFELALLDGRSAGLLEQERADIFTQELGNVPPRAEVVARITVDLRLVWLAEGAWELRFPTVIGPRYLGADATPEDAAATAIAVADGDLGARIGIELKIGDELAGGAPSSASHDVIMHGGAVELRSAAGARLDRDIVVRWPVARADVGIALDAARSAGGEVCGLLSITPPAPSARARTTARDLIVLLDTSGSMGGLPLELAQDVVARLIDSLGDEDRLELIEFSSKPRRYRADPVDATAREKRDAIAWLRARRADGATEMASAVVESLRALRPGMQRQVVVVTDGYVGGEDQIVLRLHDRLPPSCRLHVIGVGAAPNRSLACALARAGRGVEVIAGNHDEVGAAAARLIARTRAPVLTDLELSGSALIRHAPAQLPDVFAGAPVVAALALFPEGGELVLRGSLAGEPWERRVDVPPRRTGDGNPALAALYGREQVADLESRGLLRNLDREIEALGVRYQIATRLTSWVALDARRSVAPGSGGLVEEVPQELPHGTSAASFGLREGAMVYGGLHRASLSDAIPMPPRSVGRAKTMMAGDVRSRRLLPDPPVLVVSKRVRIARWFVFVVLVLLAALAWWLVL